MAAEASQILDPQEFIDYSEYTFTGNNVTVERKWCFITWLRRKATVYHAAQATRVSRVTVYRWYEGDPEFAKAWEAALQDAREIMETSIYEDALGKDGKPGNVLLKMFWAKAHDPKYRDKVTVDVSEVQDRISHMLTRLESVQRQQLPAAMTEFIDTGYSETTQEYSPNDMQFSPVSAQDQKED